MSNISRFQFGRNLAALATGEALTRLLTFVAFAHLARVLKPELFGFVEVTLAVILIASLLVDQGFPTYGAREVARRRGSLSKLVSRIVSTQIFLAIAVFLLVAVSIFTIPLNSTLRLLLLGFGAALLILPFQFSWVFQGRRMMKWVAIPQVARYLIFAILVLLLIRSPEDVLRLPLAELCAVISAAIILQTVYRSCGWRFSLKLGTALRARLFKETLPIGGSQMIWALRMYLPTVITAVVIGQAAAGYFGAAHRIMMVFQAAVAVYLMNLFPVLSEAASVSNERLAVVFQRSVSILIWPTIIVSLFAAIWSNEIVWFVFGEYYVIGGSIGTLKVMMCLIPVFIVRGHIRSALVAIDQQRSEFICSLIGIVLLLLLIPFLVRIYGFEGAAWAMLISEVVATILTFLLLWRRVPELSLLSCLIPKDISRLRMDLLERK